LSVEHNLLLNKGYTSQLLRQAIITVHVKRHTFQRLLYEKVKRILLSQLVTDLFCIHNTLLILYYVANLIVTLLIPVTACVVAVQYT